jgi:hypothetical protein
MVSANLLMFQNLTPNSSRRLLDGEIELGLCHSRWNQVVPGVTQGQILVILASLQLLRPRAMH